MNNFSLMIPSVSFVLQVILLQTCFHEILTSSMSLATRNSNIVSQLNLRETAAVDDQQPEFQLKRCVSLSSDMNQGGQAQEPSLPGVCRPRPIYSPAHSPPPELAKVTHRNRANDRLDHNTQPLLPSAVQANNSEQHVYTQLQTQLFPQMKF
jgi:hypothetical protein